MADITTSSSDLKIEQYFVDGDTRTITLKNPREVTTSDIESLQSWLQTNQPVLGDKNQAAFGKIRTVTKITTEQTQLDIDS